MDKVLTRESLREMFEEVSNQELIAGGMLGSIQLGSIQLPLMITLTPEQQEEERIAAKAW